MSDWPSIDEIDEMPDDILRRWFWQPLAAATREQQAIVRRAANRLFSPPKIAPIYLSLPAQEEPSGPRLETQKTAPAKAPEIQPEEPSSLDLFKTLFRS